MTGKLVAIGGATLAAGVLVPIFFIVAVVAALSSMLGPFSGLLGLGGFGGSSIPVSSQGASVSSHPPTWVVALDEQVSSGTPPAVACSVPTGILLAQQEVESGYNPTAVSSAGAIGLAQFEQGTWDEYSAPPPPGITAQNDIPTNPAAAAWVEARYLCSLGIARNPFDALVAYNCGNPSPTCITASSRYADRILELSALLPAQTGAQ